MQRMCYQGEKYKSRAIARTSREAKKISGLADKMGQVGTYGLACYESSTNSVVLRPSSRLQKWYEVCGTKLRNSVVLSARSVLRKWYKESECGEGVSKEISRLYALKMKEYKAFGSEYCGTGGCRPEQSARSHVYPRGVSGTELGYGATGVFDQGRGEGGCTALGPRYPISLLHAAITRKAYLSTVCCYQQEALPPYCVLLSLGTDTGHAATVLTCVQCAVLTYGTGTISVVLTQDDAMMLPAQTIMSLDWSQVPHPPIAVLFSVPHSA
eukprot:1752966-Rhodomonas_salina.3